MARSVTPAPPNGATAATVITETTAVLASLAVAGATVRLFRADSAHVTCGGLTLMSESPDELRALAGLLFDAADKLTAARVDAYKLAAARAGAS